MISFLLLSFSYTESLKVQGPQRDVTFVWMATFPLNDLYIKIYIYTCFGWFACFLTASNFHNTKLHGCLTTGWVQYVLIYCKTSLLQ